MIIVKTGYNIFRDYTAIIVFVGSFVVIYGLKALIFFCFDLVKMDVEKINRYGK